MALPRGQPGPGAWKLGFELINCGLERLGSTAFTRPRDGGHFTRFLASRQGRLHHRHTGQSAAFAACRGAWAGPAGPRGSTMIPPAR
jgi:hypothetical protein